MNEAAGGQQASGSAVPIGNSPHGSVLLLVLSGLAWAGLLAFLVFLLISRTTTS